MRNPFARNDTAEGLLNATDAPTSRAAPLRDVLLDKLREKAEEGDIAAIKLLLDSPELLERPIGLTVEEARANLIAFLQGLADRNKAERDEQEQQDLEREAEKLEAEVVNREGQRRDFWQLRFESTVEARLRAEGDALALAAWHRMDALVRVELWKEIVNGLRLLREVTDAEAGTMVQ